LAAANEYPQAHEARVSLAQLMSSEQIQLAEEIGAILARDHVQPANRADWYARPDPK